VRDQYDLLISLEAQPGEYQLEIGMCLVETGQRLAILSEGMHSPVGDKVVLGTIPIQLW
jgi:hypothetical protein